jgi:hypothetical protein
MSPISKDAIYQGAKNQTRGGRTLKQISCWSTLPLAKKVSTCHTQEIKFNPSANSRPLSRSHHHTKKINSDVLKRTFCQLAGAI